MQSPKLAKAKPGPSTVRYLDIAEIRDNTVILKDGTLRAVVLVSSVNFALKSEDEQEAIIAAYVGFLNSLEHPIQIVIQSRKLNIDGYLAELTQKEREQTNELLRAQISDYRSFISELVDLGEIMNKRFYIVVPFDPLTAKTKSFWSRLGEVLRPGAAVKLRDKQFIERRAGLDLRVSRIVGGLMSMGLAAAVLDTQTLIELYYNAYNPSAAETQKLGDVNKLQVET
jgi:predicted HTH domain antitoxin